jgi:BlaI family transcriptional regulator, penicillinase repressor
MLGELSRRERQIMEALYRLGEATVAEVVELLPEDASYHSVRVTLGLLGGKGLVNHRREGQRYVHTPAIPHDQVSRWAARNLVRTYFRGSPSRAVLGLLQMDGESLSDRELQEIADWVAEAMKGEGDDARDD